MGLFSPENNKGTCDYPFFVIFLLHFLSQFHNITTFKVHSYALLIKKTHHKDPV